MNKSMKLNTDPNYWRQKRPSYWGMAPLRKWIFEEIQNDRIRLLRSAGDEMLSNLPPHERRHVVQEIKRGFQASRRNILHMRRHAIMGLD